MNVRERLRSAAEDGKEAAAAARERGDELISAGVAVIRSDGVRVTSVLGTVALLLTVSAGGVLSGLGLFILSMVEMNATGVVGSSFLLAFSVAVFVACYGWLTR